MKVLAVYCASVRAFAGRGTVTAVVQGEAGECRLYGVTLLCKAGLLNAKHSGRYLDADTLALLLNVKSVIRGKAAVLAHAATLKGIDPECVLGDAPAHANKSGNRNADVKF